MADTEVLPAQKHKFDTTLGRHLGVALGLKPGEPIPDATKIYFNRNFKDKQDTDFVGNNAALMFKQAMGALMKGESFELNMVNQQLNIKASGPAKQEVAAVADYQATGEALKFLASANTQNLQSLRDMFKETIVALKENSTTAMNNNKDVLKESYSLDAMQKALAVLENVIARQDTSIAELKLENENLRLNLRAMEEKEIEDLSEMRKLSLQVEELESGMERAIEEARKGMENKEDDEGFMGMKGGFIENMSSLAEKIPSIKGMISGFMGEDNPITGGEAKE